MRARADGRELVASLVERLAQLGLLRCAGCGAELGPEVGFLPLPDGGVWAFVPCARCGYRNALRELLRRASEEVGG